MSSNNILLPRTDENGKPRLSYSQISNWNEAEAFSKIMEGGTLKTISGKTGYMLSYFLDFIFPENPMDIYAPFGEKVENAICSGDYKGFDEREQSVLKKIKPLGVFQKEINIDFGDFVLLGFIDDSTKDGKILRDYKTASANSSKKYYKPEYYQLDIYALNSYRNEKRLPEKLEVCVIERKGSHFKPPLVVGEEVWYIDREVSKERVEFVESEIIRTVKEISDVYKIFCEINKIKTKIE